MRLTHNASHEDNTTAFFVRLFSVCLYALSESFFPKTKWLNLTYRGPCIVSIFFLIYFQRDATLHISFISGKNALHVSGDISTHLQEHIQLYWQYLVLVNLYCYLPLFWESWSWTECGVGIVPNCDVSTYVTDRYNSHTTLRPAPTLPQQRQVAVTVKKYQIL